MILTTEQKLYADNILSEVIVSGSQKGINLGINWSPAKVKWGELIAVGINVYYPEKRKVYVEKFEVCRLGNIDGIIIKDLRLLLSEFLVCSIIDGLDLDMSEINGMVDSYLKNKSEVYVETVSGA